ncbi:MAG TPA: trypsin-like serine protease [Polyangiaceae bacterium]
MALAVIALAAIVPLVTHGTTDASDPAVVAIVTSDGVVACSGTVIAPHFVLTAGHCIVPEIAQGASVVFGTQAGAPSATVPIAASRVDPTFDAVSLADDAAILVLAAGAPAAPVPLATSAPAVGANVTLVGWGETGADAGDFGAKRTGASTVTAVDATTFTVAAMPSQPCEGDSGGPALAPDGSLAGITSHGDAACAAGAVYTRVDAVTAGFVTPTLAVLGDGTSAPGQRCLYPEQCTGGAGACLVAGDDPDVHYCTADCTFDADCPHGMLCAATADLRTRCVYPFPTPGAIGAPCTGDGDCVEGACTSAAACGLQCVPGGAACPGSSQCTLLGGVDFECTAPGTPQAEGGASCTFTRPASPAPLVLALPFVVALLRRGGRRRSRSSATRAGATAKPR